MGLWIVSHLGPGGGRSFNHYLSLSSRSVSLSRHMSFFVYHYLYLSRWYSFPSPSLSLFLVISIFFVVVSSVFLFNNSFAVSFFFYHSTCFSSSSSLLSLSFSLFLRLSVSLPLSSSFPFSYRTSFSVCLFVSAYLSLLIGSLSFSFLFLFYPIFLKVRPTKVHRGFTFWWLTILNNSLEPNPQSRAHVCHEPPTGGELGRQLDKPSLGPQKGVWLFFSGFDTA